MAPTVVVAGTIGPAEVEVVEVVAADRVVGRVAGSTGYIAGCFAGTWTGEDGIHLAAVSISSDPRREERPTTITRHARRSPWLDPPLRSTSWRPPRELLLSIHVLLLLLLGINARSLPRWWDFVDVVWLHRLYICCPARLQLVVKVSVSAAVLSWRRGEGCATPIGYRSTTTPTCRWMDVFVDAKKELSRGIRWVFVSPPRIHGQ